MLLQFKLFPIPIQDFLEASQAVSFFIKFKIFHDDANVQFLTLENGKTQEKLVIKRETEGYDYVSISRYPMRTNEEWIQEMSQHPNRNTRIIGFDA
jgi:hypothetical protein